MNLTSLIKELKTFCEQRKAQTVKHESLISFYVGMDPVWWADTLACSYQELVKAEDMRLAAEFQLRRKYYKMTRIDDDEPPDVSLTTIPTYIPNITPFGVSYEHDFKSGSYHAPAVVNRREDLERLKPPVFTQEDMKNAGQKKRAMEAETGGLVPVTACYPPEMGWFGPFSLACCLCGMNHMLEWMITDPDLVHRVMRFITESTLGYYRQKAELTGGRQEQLFISFAEDEVSGRLFSRSQYQEFILPYHHKLAGSAVAVYFHSCGDISNFIDDIITLPNLARLHFSPSTSLDKVQIVPREVVVEAHLDPVRDIEQADDQILIDKVKNIRRHCQGRRLDLRVSSIMSCPPLKLGRRAELIRRVLEMN